MRCSKSMGFFTDSDDAWERVLAVARDAILEGKEVRIRPGPPLALGDGMERATANLFVEYKEET